MQEFRQQRIEHATAARHAGGAAIASLLALTLDELTLGVVIVSGDGGILAMNGAARDLLESTRWNVPAKDGLAPRRSNERRTLREAVERMSQEIELPKAVTLVSDPEEDRLHLFGVPLGNDGGSGVAVFLCDPERKIETSEAILRDMFQLTSAEARLACALVNGLTIEEAANESGIKLNTARSHLKKIFAKTHTQRQGEMVRLLTMSLSALVLTARAS